LISFGLKYWFIYLLAAVIAAILTAAIVYYKSSGNSDLSKKQLWLLTSFRFLSFFFIALLLLSPFIKTLDKITRNPLVIVAWDNSGSVIANRDSLEVMAEIIDFKKELDSKASADFTLVHYQFGTEAKLLEKNDFSDKKSDYSQMLSTISNNHFNENIGAVVIIGDGIYNQGKNPLNFLAETSFPIFTLGYGDTTEVADARIHDIRVNRTSFSGNRFPVEIDARYTRLKGKPMKISVLGDNAELASAIVTPTNQNYFHTHEFILEAGQPGIKRYTVKTEIIENERNTRNNQSVFVINVLDKKQKILILSDGPHPDIGAIKNTLDEQTTYDISVFTEEPYPVDLSVFNLIILNQLPTTGKSVSDVLDGAVKKRIPTLFIVGNKTYLPQLNALGAGVTIQPLAGSGEEAQPIINPVFASYTLSEDLKEMIPRFPPLQVAFAEYQHDPALVPLFNQRIMNIETAKPLLAAGSLNGRKTGFIFGEGIWRWRLYNYAANQNHLLFNEFVNQLVQYLALRQNEDNFIVSVKPVFTETDEIIFNAEVYNDVFERIATEEVKMVVKNEKGEEFSFVFDIRGKDYYLNAGHLPTGDYSFTANVKLAGKEITETGIFTVTPVNIENTDLQANHKLLFQLAENSGGKFFVRNQKDDLISALKNNDRMVVKTFFQEMVNELINLKWIFAFILVLLSLEWFLRKFWGIY
jgi:hypothetical protein